MRKNPMKNALVAFSSFSVEQLHIFPNYNPNYIYLIGIHPICKAEQPLQGMQLQEKAQKDYSIQEIYLENTYS